jgi:hypothetical protein
MLQRIKCWLGFHVYRVLRPLLIGGELIECVFCTTKLCLHHGRMQVIPFDADVQLAEAQLRSLLATPQREPGTDTGGRVDVRNKG